MRVLHLIQSADPRHGGPIEGIHQLARCHAGKHTHEIACLDPAGAEFLAHTTLSTHALGPVYGPLGYSPRIGRWLAGHAQGYDAVIVHGLWRYMSVAAWRTLSRIKVPYHAFPHGMLDPWFRHTYPLKHLKKRLFWNWTEFRLLRDARSVIFTCEEERLRARRSFRPYKCREQIAVLGIAGPQIDSEAARSAFRTAFPKLVGRRVLLYLSRIHPKKGCDLLIRAFAEAHRRDPSVILMMAGPDATGWSKQLTAEAARLGVAEAVLWPGMLTGDVKWGAYLSAEAFVLPSHQENFGIVVAEALACRLPVLISNQVQIWREIDLAGAGYVAQDDFDGTRNLLLRWLDTPAREWTAMRERAYVCFNTRFRVDAYANRIIEILSDRRDPVSLQEAA